MKNKPFRMMCSRYSNQLFYLLSVMVLFFQFIVIRYDLLCKIDPDLSWISYITRSTIDALLLLLPFWLLPARSRFLIWVVIIPFTFWTLSQLWYFRTYADLMPFSSYFLFDNVSSLLMHSMIASVRPVDSLVIIPVLLLIAVYQCYFKSLIVQTPLNRKSRNRYIMGILILSSVVYLSQAFTHNQRQKSQSPTSFWNRYVKSTGNAFYLHINGFVAYCVYAATETILEHQELTDAEKEQIGQYLSKRGNSYTDNLFTATEQRNLILIVVESLNSWVISHTIDGIEVTPNLNRFCQLDHSVVALKVHPQVKDGRSSDAHFIVNTGLLPIQHGAVAVRYGSVNYPSLAKALRGYHSVEVVCDDAKFWNQNKTSVSYGFSEIYDCTTMCKDQFGRTSDQIMFAKALDVIRQQPQPFYAQLVTITMHQPYNELVVPATSISHSMKYTKEIRNYLEAVHFCDGAIGNFIDELKKEGVYDNTVIAIVSDHNEMDKNKLDGRAEIEPEDKETAMIILNAPQRFYYDKTMGQIDIYPTLLDVMNANTYYWKGLGYSIYRNPAPSSAVSWSKEVIGNVKAVEVPMQAEAWEISNLMIVKNYFDKN